MALICVTTRVQAEFPPVQWGGDVTLTYRVTGDENGDDSDQWGTTLNLRALSYIYEPWVATWFADLGITYYDSSNPDRETENQFLTGRAQVDLFPQSRFPGQLFFEATDSRITTNEDVLELGDYRLYRYGYNQRYRTESGNSWLYGSYEGTEETRLATGQQIDTQQLRLDGSHIQGNHVFDGNAIAQMTTRDPESVDNSFYVANFHHGYTPGPNFTMDSTATVAYTDADSADRSASDYDINLTNRADWQATERFRLTSNVLLDYREIDLGDDREAGDEQRADLSLLGVYDLRSDLTLSGEVAANFERGLVDREFYRQALTLSYTPDSILFEPFAYTYSLNAGVRNQTDDELGSSQIYLANGSQGLSYTKLFGDSGWTMVLDINQDGSYEEDTLLGDLTTLTHRASATASQASVAGTLYGQLSLFDFRNFGRQESDLQRVNLTLNASRQLNRYESLVGTVTGTVGRSKTEFAEDRFAFASVTANYFHQRLFGVRNLQFESELRGDYDLNRVELDLDGLDDELDPGLDLAATRSTEDERYQISWRNELDYAIGLLSVRLTTDVVHTDAGERWSVFMGVTRSF